jgi:hypothetical protein
LRQIADRVDDLDVIRAESFFANAQRVLQRNIFVQTKLSNTKRMWVITGKQKIMKRVFSRKYDESKQRRDKEQKRTSNIAMACWCSPKSFITAAKLLMVLTRPKCRSPNFASLIDRARSHKTRACGKLKAEKRENF